VYQTLDAKGPGEGRLEWHWVVLGPERLYGIRARIIYAPERQSLSLWFLGTLRRIYRMGGRGRRENAEAKRARALSMRLKLKNSHFGDPGQAKNMPTPRYELISPLPRHRCQVRYHQAEESAHGLKPRKRHHTSLTVGCCAADDAVDPVCPLDECRRLRLPMLWMILLPTASTAPMG
jgi:hypothetical protein